MKWNVAVAVMALGSVIAAGTPSHAQYLKEGQNVAHLFWSNNIGGGIEGRADFLAAFVLFGADYRGSSHKNCPECWEPTSSDPLTFHRKSDDASFILHELSACKYEIKYDSKDKATGTATSKIGTFDFSHVVGVTLPKSWLDAFSGSWLKAKTGSEFWCERVEKNGSSWSNCGGSAFFQTNSEGQTLFAPVDGGAAGEDVHTAASFFFSRACPIK